MQYSDDFKDALQYLNKNYPDTRLNNNKSVIANDSFEIEDSFRFLSMKQSHYKNVVYRKSLFENVALTGSTFENVKFLDSKLIGNSFAQVILQKSTITSGGSGLGARSAAVAVVAGGLAACQHADCHDAGEHQRSNLLEFHKCFSSLWCIKDRDPKQVQRKVLSFVNQ